MAETRATRRVMAALAAIARAKGAAGLDKPGFHPFPARMPTWLAQDIIERLTEPGEIVMDSMVGSGTTAIAALRAGRSVVGTDLDPMALLLSRVGTTVFDPDEAKSALAEIGARAQRRIDRGLRVGTARASFAEKDQEFLKYWFPPRSQKELFALAQEIAATPDGKDRDLAWVVLSSLISATSAGSSYALDISRSRPHKVEDKRIVNPLEAWDARAESAISRLPFTEEASGDGHKVWLRRADARKLPVADASIDLVVTSPPYLNAIDYMRSHKFSLLWMGRPLSELRVVRGKMIGTERGMYSPDSLPSKLEDTIEDSIEKSTRLGQVRRYLSDMRRVLLEIKRVLRPGGAVVMALGPSIISTEEPDAGEVIGSLAESVGLVKVGTALRALEGTRRSLPPPFAVTGGNPLRLRMEGEVFLGLLKD